MWCVLCGRGGVQVWQVGCTSSTVSSSTSACDAHPCSAPLVTQHAGPRLRCTVHEPRQHQGFIELEFGARQPGHSSQAGLMQFTPLKKPRLNPKPRCTEPQPQTVSPSPTSLPSAGAPSPPTPAGRPDGPLHAAQRPEQLPHLVHRLRAALHALVGHGVGLYLEQLTHTHELKVGGGGQQGGVGGGG